MIKEQYFDCQTCKIPDQMAQSTISVAGKQRATAKTIPVSPITSAPSLTHQRDLVKRAETVGSDTCGWVNGDLSEMTRVQVANEVTLTLRPRYTPCVRISLPSTLFVESRASCRRMLFGSRNHGLCLGYILCALVTSQLWLRRSMPKKPSQYRVVGLRDQTLENSC